LWTVIFHGDAQLATPTLVGEIDYVVHTTHVLITCSIRNVTHGPSPFSMLQATKSWEGPGTRLCNFLSGESVLQLKPYCSAYW